MLFKMNKYGIHTIFYFLVCLLFGIQANAQIETKYYDELDHIRIDSIVYYEIPYKTVSNKPTENDYKPVWYWGYCALNYPLAFNNYIKEANKFIAKDVQHSEIELEEYYDTFKKMKPEDFRVSHNYYFGEVYFTHLDDNKHYLMILSYNYIDEIPNMDLKNVDTTTYDVKRQTKIDPLDINTLLRALPTAKKYYELEDGIYKSGNTLNISNDVMKKGDKNLYFEGNRIDKFQKILRRTQNYTRSRIIEGKRIFEKVEHSPNGIKILKTWNHNVEKVNNKEKNSETIENFKNKKSNSWIWYVIIGIVLLTLLFIIIRKKNR